jgi:ABC-type branched-subunit amino acid transport system ATPase component
VSDPILRTEQLHRWFGGLHAVNGVDLTVEEGSLHAVIGPNGSGKTTL